MSSSLRSVLFVIPVFDDWEAAGLLLYDLGTVARREGWRAEVLLVDDGSTEPWEVDLGPPPEGIARLDVLELRRNVGHQRAIAVGLAWAHEHREADAVVVMDGDGEDRPESVPGLLAKVPEAGHRAVVFAKRARRSESLLFRLMYHAFRVFHRVFTGRRVEVGNFSAMSWGALDRLMGLPEMGHHYAAAVEKARIPMLKVPTPRGRRLRGRGKMDFVALVRHGLAAMSVWGEEIGARLLVGSAGLVLAALAGVVALLGAAWHRGEGAPVAALLGAGLLAVVALNGLLLSVVFSFLVLRARTDQAFLPLRDYAHYARRCVQVERSGAGEGHIGASAG